MPVPLRADVEAQDLRALARRSKDAAQTRRLLALAAMIETGPVPAIHGVVRWRLIDLCQWLWEEFRISVAKQTLSRELRAMGYRKLSARPRHHAQAAGAAEHFGKASPPCWMRSRAQRGSRPATSKSGPATSAFPRSGDRLARIGQKNKIARRWAPRGTRPVAPRDQRTASTCIFDAICPEEGKAAGLVLPRCNTEAMTLHLAAISTAVAPGRHAALLVDRAGWRTTRPTHRRRDTASGQSSYLPSRSGYSFCQKSQWCSAAASNRPTWPGSKRMTWFGEP
jgi:hypothetical protein